MSDKKQYCACLHIKYSPELVEFKNPVTGKTILGTHQGWKCNDCGAEFSKTLWHNAVNKQQQDEIESLRAEVKSVLAEINDIDRTEREEIVSLRAENKKLRYDKNKLNDAMLHALGYKYFPPRAKGDHMHWWRPYIRSVAGNSLAYPDSDDE